MEFTGLVDPIVSSAATPPQKAILWGAVSLLAELVELLLKTGPGWDVIKIASDCGVEYLVQQIKVLKPALVVVCQEKDASNTALLMQLDQVQACLKVVTVSMESNLLHIYTKQNVVMQNVSDFLSAVDIENFSKTQLKEEVQAVK